MSGPPSPELPALAADPPGLRDAFGHVLRYGVLVSGLFLVVGFLLAAARGSTGLAGSTGRLPLDRLSGALGAGDPWAYLFVGVVVLAATPVVRVTFALGGFAAVRDRAYVLITGFVLAVLLTSLAIGAVG
ncbi:MAG: DUF1634 domain-containing protein [Candidatus Lutacidiplasmatales archaeon]